MKLDHRMQKSPSKTIFLLVVAIFLTLCVGPADSASDSGAITIVVAQEPVNLDVGHSVYWTTSRLVNKNIMEPLVQTNPDDNSITPRLATSWRQIDENTWHFSLRKDVKFHDGADFNAEAVIFNIKRLYSEKLISPLRLKFFSNIKLEAKALDSHTVEIKTDKFEPLLLPLMETLVICSPNTPSDKMTRQPIGTGPYKFVKWDSGTQIVFERSDGYWGKQPQVKKAVYVWRLESSVRASMVELGEADLAPNIAGQDATNPDMDHSYFDSNTSYIRIGLWEPPLNDRRVRMALNYAVDRNAIRGTILSKDVVPATQLVVPQINGYNPRLEVWPYDPQKAKQLLDEARKDGVPVDKEILLVSRSESFPHQNELVETIMNMERAVGFNMKLMLAEEGTYIPYRNKPYPEDAPPYILMNRHDNAKGDAVFTVFGKYHCKGNQSAVCDKALDDLIEIAQIATGEVRKKLWQATFRRIQEDIVHDIILFHMVAYARVGKRINYKPSVATCNEIELSQITFKQ
jgi:peptide/nickel transport system substrate-binding protein